MNELQVYQICKNTLKSYKQEIERVEKSKKEKSESEARIRQLEAEIRDAQSDMAGAPDVFGPIVNIPTAMVTAAKIALGVRKSNKRSSAIGRLSRLIQELKDEKRKLIGIERQIVDSERIVRKMRRDHGRHNCQNYGVPASSMM